MLGELISTAGVREVHRPGGDIGVMAIHGGLEEGTDVIAHAVAEATGAAMYAVIQPDTLWWHIPSIRYDPDESAALATFLASVSTAISLHGYGEPGLESTALLGGNNRDFASSIHTELASRGLDSIVDLDAIPKRLRGTHRLNPVNLPPESGVQVELPMNLREGKSMELVIEALCAAVANGSRSPHGVAG